MTFNDLTANNPTNGNITQNHSGENINNKIINVSETNKNTQSVNFPFLSTMTIFFTKIMFSTQFYYHMSFPKSNNLKQDLLFRN